MNHPRNILMLLSSLCFWFFRSLSFRRLFVVSGQTIIIILVGTDDKRLWQTKKKIYDNVKKKIQQWKRLRRVVALVDGPPSRRREIFYWFFPFAAVRSDASFSPSLRSPLLPYSPSVAHFYCCSPDRRFCTSYFTCFVTHVGANGIIISVVACRIWVGGRVIASFDVEN